MASHFAAALPLRLARNRMFSRQTPRSACGTSRALRPRTHGTQYRGRFREVSPMNTRLPKLGTSERAVYHLVEAGQVNATTAGLYRRELRALAEHELVQRTDDGGWAAVLVKGEERPRTTPPPSTPPSRPYSEPPPNRVPMQTLVVRVPQEWLDTLDARGPDRSTALREVLGRALASGSGTRRARAS